MAAIPVSITGKWSNKFNSVMDIKPVNSQGWFAGSYASTTGATGTYLIIGLMDPTIGEIDNGGTGVPCAMALSWHPLDGKKSDTTWHWVSGLGGQFILPPQGSPEFDVLHSFTTSTKYPALGIIEGSYLGDLQFMPYADDTHTPLSGLDNEVAKLEKRLITSLPDMGNVTSTWKSIGDKNISIALIEETSSPLVFGSYSDETGVYLLQGLVDNHAKPDNLAFKSVSFLTMFPDPMTGKLMAVSMSGSINLAQNTMSVLTMHCRSCEYANRYLQTQVENIQFSRA